MGTTALNTGFELCWYEHQAIGLRASARQAYRHWSDNQLLAAQAAGAARVNGVVELAERALQPGERVCVWPPDHQEGAVETRWQLLWKHRRATGIPHHAESVQYINLAGAARHPIQTRALIASARCRNLGHCIAGKKRTADKLRTQHLGQLLQRKVYHALVWGNPLRDGHNCETWLAEQRGSAIRTRMMVTTGQDDNAVPSPNRARTHFRVLQRFSSHALLECELFTERKHQIRAQLGHAVHSIIGDKIYSHDGALD